VKAWLRFVGMLYLCNAAIAQISETGRWQELAFSSKYVHNQTEDRYLEIVVKFAANGQLDKDCRLLNRIQSISAELIHAAIDMKPEAKAWTWEVHVSGDPMVDAFCTTDVKILIGSTFVYRLNLDDGELATLIGHGSLLGTG
jgi:Zn-dependent protease with chaperone function